MKKRIMMPVNKGRVCIIAPNDTCEAFKLLPCLKLTSKIS